MSKTGVWESTEKEGLRKIGSSDNASEKKQINPCGNQQQHISQTNIKSIAVHDIQIFERYSILSDVRNIVCSYLISMLSDVLCFGIDLFSTEAS